jgi:hypothetical protein
MEPYLQLALSFLNVALKQTKAQLCIFPMSVTPCGLLTSGFTTTVPIHLPPFLQLRHAIVSTVLSFEPVTRDYYNG